MSCEIYLVGSIGEADLESGMFGMMFHGDGYFNGAALCVPFRPSFSIDLGLLCNSP